ncbi:MULTISPECIES: DUF4232 domain-containing protein [Streptomyces]|uniref:DUF4232 domain-containing protein n=1 Tax=Streptomyces TaxID=1883 RepID=UPI001F0F8DDB|nr:MULTISPECIES: DUF4232 domain-containing protein [Streptomyces]
MHRGSLTAAVAVAIAALSMTACADGSGTRAEGSSTAVSSTGSPSGSSSDEDEEPAPHGSWPRQETPADTPAGKEPAAGRNGETGAGGSATGGNGRTGTGDSGTGDGAPCQGSHTATVAAPLNRPVNHMLLTVTNTGSVPCRLYGYPVLRFGEAQSPPVIERSKPRATVTLAPSESGYACASLSATNGSGANGRTETSLTVAFQGRSAGEDIPAIAHPALPAGGVYVDDSLDVTYWQQSMRDATRW